MELRSPLIRPVLTAGCAIALTTLSACADSTGPPPVAIDHRSGELALSTPDVDVDFADAMVRVLPGISNRSAAKRIAHELRECAVAVELRDYEAARVSLALLHQLLSATDMHPSNRAAMKLTLQAVESLIDTRCRATGECDVSDEPEDSAHEPTPHMLDEAP